jgi:type II secretory pathway pseudopilin PulG
MKQTRIAFTLVELLVVMSLIVILAALTIAFFPSVASSAREGRAATLLQGWLNLSRQRALRDQSPRGVRLWVKPGTYGGAILPLVVTECQYIEQPDDFAGFMKPVSVPGLVEKNTIAQPAGGDPRMIFFNFGTTAIDLTNGYGVGPGFAKYWAVQPGDYLEVNGVGLMHRIEAVLSGTQIQISPAMPHLLTQETPNYRIVRLPRAVGDEMLKLPEGTVIDVETNGAFGAFSNPLPSPSFSNTGLIESYDILFAPSGEVISRGVSTDKIHLWVRAPFVDAPTVYFRGDPTLVSVWVRTGFVGAYSPDQSTPNPYSLVR